MISAEAPLLFSKVRPLQDCRAFHADRIQGIARQTSSVVWNAYLYVNALFLTFPLFTGQ